ncbi:MAG: aminopeptidase P family protein [Candidatus Eiseniibacteriota bacterium]|nr:MAG: aminopeptidase P family protein [Candidatus Eisenbacteria bacterium]
MKSDIPGLMSERGLDAIMIAGGGVNNPIMTYMTGPARLLRSFYAMKADGTSLLVHNPMERDEAAETGLPCSTFADFKLKDLTRQEQSEVRGEARMMGLILEKLGVKGKVGLYGNIEASRLLMQVEFLKQTMNGIEIALEGDRTIFDVARGTKNESEIEQMKDVGRRSCESLALVRDFLFSCKIERNRLVKSDGKPLKLGDLRSMMRRELIQRGLVESSGTIISMGRDSAVPHNFGNDEQIIEPGKTIVMDVFPGEIGGGYKFDITRTYCVGDVPEEVKKVYDDVLGAQELVLNSLKVDTPARIYQDQTCEFFESRGYRTIRQDDTLQEGYVHGTGHGIGLEVHEKPRLAGPETNSDEIVRGSVFTVEPGLYFPSRGIGVRIEDIVYARPEGKFEVLVDFPRELSPVWRA